MEIASKVFAFREALASLNLYSSFALSDVEKTREGAIDVSVDVFPRLDMEHGIHLRYLANDYPVAQLSDLRQGLVSVSLLGWGGLKTYWAHVVVVAVIDVCLLLILQAFC